MKTVFINANGFSVASAAAGRPVVICLKKTAELSHFNDQSEGRGGGGGGAKQSSSVNKLVTVSLSPG